MPQVKKNSIKCRSKGKHYYKTKRGGDDTDHLDKLDVMERGQQHGDYYVMPIMINPKDIRDTSNKKAYQPQISSPEEVYKVFEDRSARLAELDALDKKYTKIREKEKLKEEEDNKKIKQEIQRLKDVRKIEDLNRNHLTSEEVSKFFDNQPNDCTGPTCVVSGGRKSRRYRRNGRKSRKSRKH